MVDPPPSHNEGTEKSWKQNALCFRLTEMGLRSADLWFQDEFTPESKEAADICFDCPVRRQCLEQACETKEGHGIWGGLPLSVRTRKGRSHNYSRLTLIPNPYDTDDEDSPYHPNNLSEGEPDE